MYYELCALDFYPGGAGRRVLYDLRAGAIWRAHTLALHRVVARRVRMFIYILFLFPLFFYRVTSYLRCPAHSAAVASFVLWSLRALRALPDSAACAAYFMPSHYWLLFFPLLTPHTTQIELVTELFNLHSCSEPVYVRAVWTLSLFSMNPYHCVCASPLLSFWVKIVRYHACWLTDVLFARPGVLI